MTEQEFLAAVSEVSETYYELKDKNRRWDNSSVCYKFYKRTGLELKNINLDDVILETWTTGGIGGGNCWGEGGHCSMTGEPEPEFASLDAILEKVCPGITYLKYKKLIEGLVNRDDYEVGEYYGNSTTYGIKTIKLRDLYEKLKSLGLV